MKIISCILAYKESRAVKKAALGMKIAWQLDQRPEIVRFYSECGGAAGKRQKMNNSKLNRKNVSQNGKIKIKLVLIKSKSHRKRAAGEDATMEVKFEKQMKQYAQNRGIELNVGDEKHTQELKREKREN